MPVMARAAHMLLCQLLLLQGSSYVWSYSVAADPVNPDGVVVAESDITASAGSQTLLQCQSYRMVWTQDSLKDRQRVVHWDLYSMGGAYKAERLVDMYSAGEQRIYSPYNQERIFMSETAFSDGNFSLILRDVALSDQGYYHCSLHHHYCHLYETVKVQLNVTKNERRAKIYWDGEKVVIVAFVGTTVALPCENRDHLWTERYREEDQQVVHWDRQPPGVPHDRADRLIDLYASGERRSYGPLFIRRRMDIRDSAFTEGDFSLTISELGHGDEGTYSCHLHHHYCGLHERRIFRLSVVEPVKEKESLNKTDQPIAPAIVSFLRLTACPQHSSFPRLRPRGATACRFQFPLTVFPALYRCQQYVSLCRCPASYNCFEYLLTTRMPLLPWLLVPQLDSIGPL